MGESKQCRVCGVYVVDDVSVRDEICRTCRMERAAPQMLEALRKAEWKGPRAFAGPGSGPTCPWCGQPRPPKSYLGNGHASDCAWDAAIKAATGGDQ